MNREYNYTSGYLFQLRTGRAEYAQEEMAMTEKSSFQSHSYQHHLTLRSTDAVPRLYSTKSTIHSITVRNCTVDWLYVSTVPYWLKLVRDPVRYRTLLTGVLTAGCELQ